MDQNFDNTKQDASQQKLIPYYMMVENIVLSFGLNPEECRKETGRWAFYRGSALVLIDIYHSQPNNEDYILISSPVVRVPKTNTEKFYKRILEINHFMYQASFSIKESQAFLKILRECRGLDSDEIKAMIQRVGYYADEYDDILKQEFGV
jgi:hypothetical protein